MLRLALAGLLLAVLAYGILAGVGTGAPASVGDADCFHIGTEGVAGHCRDAPAPAPTAAEQAANWAWWGEAAAPVALAGVLITLWLMVKRRFSPTGRTASQAPARP